MQIARETLVSQEAPKKRLVIVVSKCTLDMLYPPLILALTGPTMNMEVDLYFTFWGLNLLTKKGNKRIKLPPVGNPGLPLPNILGILPGMTAMATKMMENKIKKYWPTPRELLKMAKDSGVRIHACSPTMGLMGVKKEDLIPEVDDIIGASTFLDLAADNAITLFV